MKYEDIIDEIGGCSSYQIWILSTLYLIAVIDGFHATSLILLVPITKHRCAIPDWPNDTYEEQGQHHKLVIDSFIPQEMENGQMEYSSCYIYKNDTSSYNRTRHKCDSWVYDKSVFQTSITADMNLVCDRKEMNTYFMLAYFIGAFVATLTCGWLADRYGRKPIIIVTLLTQGISSIVISQMTTIEPILVLKFFSSWGGSGVYVATAVFGTEISSKSHRKSAAVIIHTFYTLGCMLLALMAYFIRTWRLLVLIVSIPSLPLALLYVWILPESPRWLLTTHNNQKATKIFIKMAEMNNKKPPSSTFSKEEIQVSLKTKRKVQVWKMFTIPTLLKRSLISMYNWSTINFVYNGLVLNIRNLSGNTYLNIFLNVITEIPGYLICIPLLNRIGRKRLFSIFIITAGLLGISTIFPLLYPSKGSQWIMTCLSALNRFCIAGCFGIIYLLTCELYPTVIRNAALGTVSTCARFGGIISPYILKSTELLPGQLGQSLPMVIMGGVCFTSGILVNFLPETNNRDLQENFEELDREEKERKKRRNAHTHR